MNKVWSDSKVSCEWWSEEDVKEGEEDCKDDSRDVASVQAGCKDDASGNTQTSDLGVSPDLSISESGDYKKTIPCIIYSLIIVYRGRYRHEIGQTKSWSFFFSWNGFRLFLFFRHCCVPSCQLR